MRRLSGFSGVYGVSVNDAGLYSTETSHVHLNIVIQRYTVRVYHFVFMCQGGASVRLKERVSDRLKVQRHTEEDRVDYCWNESAA